MTFRHTRNGVAVALAATTLASCAPAVPASPAQLARCQKLYGLWWNYEQDPVFLHTGERVQAELALDDCQHGRYDEGIRTLKEILAHGGFQVGSL